MPFGGMWGGHIMHEASLTTALQRSATVSFPAFCHQAERTTPPPRFRSEVELCCQNLRSDHVMHSSYSSNIQTLFRCYLEFM